MDSILQRLILFGPPFLLAISVHESAHAYVAYRFGDSTAKHLGRITLNPIPHIDIMGAMVLLFAGFGWAKPVPVNPDNLKDPRKDGIWISLAGPASNLILAIISGIIYQFLAPILPDTQAMNYLQSVIYFSVILNIILMVFNLLPFPPLDGFHILEGIVSEDMYIQLQQLKRIGPMILLGLILLGNFTSFRFFEMLFSPFISVIGGLLLGSPHGG